MAGVPVRPWGMRGNASDRICKFKIQNLKLKTQNLKLSVGCLGEASPYIVVSL